VTSSPHARQVAERFERVDASAVVSDERLLTHAILDTGAGRCIIGEKTLQVVLSQFPKHVCVRPDHCQ